MFTSTVMKRKTPTNVCSSAILIRTARMDVTASTATTTTTTTTTSTTTTTTNSTFTFTFYSISTIFTTTIANDASSAFNIDYITTHQRIKSP